jgi:hypothetical protein
VVAGPLVDPLTADSSGDGSFAGSFPVIACLLAESLESDAS